MNGPKPILNKRPRLDHNRRLFGRRSILNRSPFAWVAIAVVALATGLAIWQVPDDGEISLTDDDMVLREQLIEPISRDPSAEGENLLPEGEQARALIRELQVSDESPAQTAFEKAGVLQAEGRRVDAYLLYFFAARQGHSGAALELGTQADPAYHSADTSTLDAPDPMQALKWYKVAIEGGDSTAQRRLTELRNQIELQASTGDEQARRLMLQWK